MGRKLWIPLVIKNVLVFGGIWAVTATSVALVRYPSLTGEHLADGEVETLDLEEFAPKGKDNIPFASKYPSYFASATEVNKKFWQDRFNDRRGEGNKIEVKEYPKSPLDIVSALDKTGEPHQEGKSSLMGFCREGYSTKSSFGDVNKEWSFSSDKSTQIQGHLKVWSLCSVFGGRPETLIKRNDTDDNWTSMYSLEQLGGSAPYSLVKDNQNAFWAIREQEWQVTNVGDSTYFGNDKKEKNSINNLCKEAYGKDTTEKDSENTPSKTTITKYCGLEWTWD